MKKIISITLCIFALCLLCGAVQANAATIVDSGTCGADGDNLTWTLDDAGTLTIRGAGKMADYNNYYGIKPPPWYSERSGIVTVVLQNSVTSIGEWAFGYCSSLTNITIPDSVTSIGGYAFSDCSSLTSITIPDSVTSVGYDAFYGCSSLTSITIPDGVTQIGAEAFSDCSSLNAVYITDIAAWCAIEFGDVISNPLYYAEKLYLNNALVTELVIPDGVTQIGNYAFSGCSGLTSITIPDGVTSIGGSAFFGCRSLKSITIPDSVTSIGGYAFSDCSSLTSITIPDDVTSIGNDAFYNCSSLTSITIPDGVTKIGNYAFCGCSSLISIVLPDSVTSIGWYAFGGCTSLTVADISTGITEISDEMFYGCSSLTSITIPDGVTSIGDDAFYNCRSLKSISIPDSVTSIGGSAFEGCSSLKSIAIPDGVTSIGVETFSGCSSLTRISVPDSVTYIGRDAFEDCNQLTALYITDIAAWCEIDFVDDGYHFGCYANPLYYADSLYLNNERVTKLVIPEGVTAIKANAFNCSAGISSIVIPNSVTYIGTQALDSYGLYEVHITDLAAWCNISFEDEYSNPMSRSLVEKLYLNNELVTELVIPEGVTRLNSYVFDGCDSITSVEFSADTLAVMPYAFSGAKNLKTVIIPSTVTQIAGSAFDQSSLTIFGFLGTYAEKFAEMKEYKFEPLDDVVYTVCYDAVGGTGAPAEQSKGHDAKFNLSTVKPSKQHCTFLGWALAQGGAVVYQPGDVFKTNADTTLYAVWAEPTLSANNATCASGRSFSITISLENNPGLCGLHLEAAYADVLELTAISKSEALSNLEFTVAGDLNANPVVLPWDGETADDSNGDIVVLTFKVKDTATPDAYAIHIDVVDAYATLEESVAFENLDITVNVVDYIPGDISGDGKITVRDVTTLRQHIAGGYNVEVVEAALDVNGDGKITVRDVTHLRQYIAGGYGVTL